MPVEFPAFGPFGDQSLNSYEAVARLVFAQTVEAPTKFCCQIGHRILVIKIEPVVIGARQIEKLAQPTHVIGAEDAVAWCVEERGIGVGRQLVVQHERENLPQILEFHNSVTTEICE